jgi:hypothetical protein
VTPLGSLDEWQDFNRCLSMYDRWIDDACSFFVIEPDVLVPDTVTPSRVRLRGKLSCYGGLVLHVDIALERDSRDQVRGVNYRYQAQFAKPPLRQIFRYDNDHTYAREGHPDAFHKHIFSNRTWREVEVVHIGRDNFPTLAEVIDELYQWWLENRYDTLVYF